VVDPYLHKLHNGQSGRKPPCIPVIMASRKR